MYIGVISYGGWVAEHTSEYMWRISCIPLGYKSSRDAGITFHGNRKYYHGNGQSRG